MRHTVEVPCRIYAMVKTHEAFKLTAEQLSVHNKSGRRRGLKFQITFIYKIRTSVCRELVRDLMRRATNSTIVVLFCDSQRTVHTLTVERRLGSVIAFFVGRTRTSCTSCTRTQGIQRISITGFRSKGIQLYYPRVLTRHGRTHIAFSIVSTQTQLDAAVLGQTQPACTAQRLCIVCKYVCC